MFHEKHVTGAAPKKLGHSMLLYVHVPFCRSRCGYCAFHSIALGKKTSSTAPLLRQYMDTLFLEAALWGDRLGKQRISTIFVGGGTPSLLPAAVIGALLDRIARNFSLEKGSEITLEGNPESLLEHGYMHDVLAAGVNRISMGVQSLQAEHLRLLGRAHSPREAVSAIMAARSAGVQNLNLDLMWGLPGQRVRQWLHTLKEIVLLRPEHVSAYGLSLEPDTALEAACREGKIALPSEREQSHMYMEGAELLESAGYIHYEISNFSRMGFQCRHNVGYWEGRDYLGLGPSATSTLSGRRWSNSPSTLEWTAAVKSGAPDAEAEELGIGTRVLELMMLRLRTARGLRVKAYHELTGRDFLHDHKKLIQALHNRSLIRIRNGYLRFTRSGMLVSNSILGKLFEDTRSLLPENEQKKLS